MTLASVQNPLFRGVLLVNRIVYRFVNLFSRAGLNSAVRRVVAQLDAAPAPQRVLSIGAGGRLGAVVCGLRNGSVTQLDIDPARKPDLLADVCEMPEIPDESFDAIFALEILEHVQAPHRAVAELARVLRPGGRIMVSVPFLFEIHEAPHDYYRYTRYGLAYLCRDLAEVEITARNGYVFAALVPGMRLIMSPYLTDMIFAWLFCLCVAAFWPVLWILDRCIRSEAATSGYIVLARKPVA